MIDNKISISREELELFYKKYNKKAYFGTDPIEYIYEYDDCEDREIVGFIASSLAYGRVAQIRKNLSFILSKMGDSPRKFVMDYNKEDFFNKICGFKHRFCTDTHIISFISAIRNLIIRFGSIENAFTTGISKDDNTLLPAMMDFYRKMCEAGLDCPNHLLPDPEKGSACKRFCLYLRWMVRDDDVDTGCWKDVDKRMLIMPLDTHIHRVCKAMGLTSSNQANMKIALEITEKLSNFSPDDPVKYDFSLTRAAMDGGELSKLGRN